MKVLHLHKITGVSGSERHLLTLLPALRQRGIDARMLSLGVDGTDAPRFYRALDELGVPNTVVRCGRDLSPRLARDVVRAVRADGPDLLHTHLVHADVYGSIASSVTRVPFVSSRHNDDRYLLGPFRYVDRAFARRASRLIAISDAVRDFLVGAGLPARKLVTVRYGLDELPPAASDPPPADAGVPADAMLVLAVGRLIAQKDHATLIRAFARIQAEHGDAVLAILGGGPLEAELHALGAELGLGDGLVLPGRSEIRDWLERADVFAHSSRWEGFGIVLLEAMLAGLPIVATRVSAVPEVVLDGETGLLVEPGDDRALADGLALVLREPDRAKELGAGGLARARSEFSVARMTDRTIDLYREAAGEAAAGS